MEAPDSWLMACTGATIAAAQSKAASDSRRRDTALTCPKRRTTLPPPWTLMVWPLTQRDAGEQSHSMALATSSGPAGPAGQIVGMHQPLLHFGVDAGIGIASGHHRADQHRIYAYALVQHVG